MEHAGSYWAATANPSPRRHALDRRIQTDVAIIGGGFTGLATSYFLGKLGIKSIVLEQNRVGWGASGRNGGMVTTGFKKSASSMAKRWGLEEAKKMLNLSVDAIKLVNRIVKEHNIQCSYSQCGSIKMAFKPSHFDHLKRQHEYMLKNFDYPTTLVERSSMQEELRSNLYYGGLIDPHSDSFHPLNYAIGLAEIAEDLGASIYEETPVLSIQKKGTKFDLKTPNGAVQADELVVATNAYTSEITKKLSKSIMPIGSHILTTEPLPKELTKKLIPKKRMVTDTKNFLYYFRLTPDGQRILFGGRVSFDSNPNRVDEEKLYTDLRENLLTVFPELNEFKIDYKWGGLTAFTMDMFPHIGKLEDGTHFALGYCGHGVAQSTLLAKFLADNIAKKDRIISRLEKLPLKTIPLHGQRATILNLVGQYYRLCDAIGS
ncbi:NAD(P)/FAD-dependent oxidoreductase [Ammoniphilus sp. 3BR4]|uniref:NAD(P)/FAD-dependent oxidoreductase n=1 Tax=Ammoniphilus sp. 3BR4 TaxID=3158265 RepID=UPI003465D590